MVHIKESQKNFPGYPNPPPKGCSAVRLAVMLRGAVLLGVAASACAFSSVFPASSTMVPRRSTTATRSLRTSVKMMDIDAGQVLAAAPGFVALGALLGKQGTESGNGMVCKCA